MGKPTPEEKGREKSPHIEGGCNRLLSGVSSTGPLGLVVILPQLAPAGQRFCSRVLRRSLRRGGLLRFAVESATSRRPASAFFVLVGFVISGPLHSSASLGI